MSRLVEVSAIIENVTSFICDMTSTVLTILLRGVKNED